MGPGWSPGPDDARPHVAGAGGAHGDDGSTAVKDNDREESQAGGGEGLELLHPTERRRPDQSVQAHSGVGDHPNGVRDAEERQWHRRRPGAGSHRAGWSAHRRPGT
jgi:hypothetical protein